MRDEEIIKALTYCLAQGITSECERCRDKIGCRDTLLRDALDLINSQKAEKEELTEQLNFLEQGYKKLYEKNKKLLLKLREKTGKASRIVEKTISLKARKEFAERVKKRAASRTYAQIWDSDLDEVLAEMEEWV